jgi:hypothetical protein
MEILRLIKITFDNLENESAAARHEEDLGTFVNEPTIDATNTVGKTAYVKVGELLCTLEIKLYLGWDGQVYPQFRVEKVWVR